MFVIIKPNIHQTKKRSTRLPSIGNQRKESRHSMAAKSWRDVARLARVHKFDRFQKSSDKPAANDDSTPHAEDEPFSKQNQAAPMPEPEITSQDDGKSSQNARFASMDFRRKTTDSFRSGLNNKRASWSGARPCDTSFEGGAMPPPPPPKPGKEEIPMTNENKSPPDIPQKPVEASPKATDKKTKVEATKYTGNENARPFGTPTKVPSDGANGSTPLQQRSNNVMQQNQPPKSALKPVLKMAQTKPFAKLLKDGSQTFYELLEISEDVDEREILKAFRAWARVTHPDHNKDPTATEDFQALQQVYETLKNTKTRLAYNCRQKIRRCAFGSRTRNYATAAV